MQRARTQEAKDERRLTLLEAALDEFFERGFTAARMDDIAARAGVSKGTLYLYFDSKEALFESLVETFALPNIERLEETARSAPSAEAAIRALMQLAPVILRTTNVPRLMKMIMADAPNFPETVRAYRRNVLERILGALAGMLRRAHAAGEITVEDPDLMARLVAAPVAFSGLWQVTFGWDPEAQLDLEALFALHADMLMRGLGIETEASP